MRRLLATLSLCSGGLSFYSIKQASECVENIGMVECFQFAKDCGQQISCQEELAKYQSCSFEGEPTHIFNGNCFREWLQNSKETQPLISCLNQKCNLTYNSLIDPPDLFKCVQNTVVANFQDCEENCMKQLNKIRDKFNTHTIEELFSIPIEDPVAHNLVGLIKTDCLFIRQKQQDQQNSQQL